MPHFSIRLFLKSLSSQIFSGVRRDLYDGSYGSTFEPWRQPHELSLIAPGSRHSNTSLKYSSLVWTLLFNPLRISV